MRLILPAALAALLAGCAPLTPQPAADPGLPARYASDAGDAAVAPPAWRDYFADPALQAQIEQALAHNRDRALALARLDEARALAGLQASQRAPQIALDLQGQRARVPADLNLTRRPLLGDQFQFGLGLASWELDLWGRLASLDTAARQAWLASDAAAQAVTLSLIHQVAQTWLQLAELDERLRLARRALDSREESLRIFTRRVELGATSRLALTQVQLLQTQAAALVSQLQQQREAQWQALTLLIGGAPAPGEPRLAELPPLRAGLPAGLLRQRPDLITAEHQLRAADANVEAARAAYLPRISLTAAFGSASAELSGLLKAGSSAWTVTPDVALPLLDGGRREQALAVQQARRRQALLAYERTAQQALRDVNDALSARQRYAEQLAIAGQTLAAQAERARLALRRYDTGAAAFLEVLDAQRDLLAAEQQQVQARRALLASQASLYAALGGGDLVNPANEEPKGNLP
ncbi:efflux transporter outer membrane subunit [Roseateles saccharophilus]|uniref:Multidrug efflux system outer membrane protein n=1 Tax=Roseateles saccharophilus TaxID=304 RepID=A0A4V2VSD7_ROSSA|nr:efflux transporter outer membrane subunit [Roseateles saccharophilus]MDG0834377.1 efflux transporter outer membrane subunit [Roseateles saccharophilus]TCV01980.1 multidrug efflux system outer membrane protein [Roseateles saccharophilus]